MSPNERLATHGDIATSLALLSDLELAELVASGTSVTTGIGGRGAVTEVAGRRVFVKRVPVTDLELRPANVRSTANLFGLPTFCQYNIGGPGGGAWRELAAHAMTTNWVLTGRFAGFPLLHHWRVLPDAVQPLPKELADVERAVAFWGGAEQVRARIEALASASASLTLFLEYVPYTLHDWLTEQLATDDTACAFVESELEAVVAFLRDHELLHLDTHFGNILTDGHRLYLADYGLALSSRFRLTPEERDFYDRHRDYDRAYATGYLANWLVTTLRGCGGEERNAFMRACAEGAPPVGLPSVAASVVARHARTAVVMADFIGRLQSESRETPYPYEALRTALATGT
ncbi:protein kinase family protein [Streptomyces sp. DG2A-72]|uniref:protein kinase family protein n=1 Tax=Streptomyces sp. DG2A-72 TaxID=3051386 RepID=UPI00265C515E|nr:protein kinase family protein [Streptomyces sp. DG2A-72]MDO0931017.1 protein kinase family protein [Streptomyces sp. DG2A-72]